MVDINKVPIFTQEVFHFTLPNFEEWKKQIYQIILVEENKNIHGHSTIPEKGCNVMANRTAWNSHQRYPIINDLCKEISSYLKEFIEKEGYDIPDLRVYDCWVNWYEKNQHARPHCHGHFLSVVFFVDVEKSDGKFFFNSNSNAILVKKGEKFSKRSDTVQVDAKDGTVLFFDGSIFHSVSNNLTNNKRVTVAINFSVEYSETREEY